MDPETIQERLARMTLDERRYHRQAIRQGFEAEKCLGCGLVLLAHHHFVFCDKGKQCSMTDGITLLEQMSGF